jgi:hypothetical protein
MTDDGKHMCHTPCHEQKAVAHGIEAQGMLQQKLPSSSSTSPYLLIPHCCSWLWACLAELNFTRAYSAFCTEPLSTVWHTDVQPALYT